MSRSAWWLIVDVLAVYRLTHLIVDDTITRPIRQRLLAGPDWFAELVSCNWCISIWIAGGVVALTRLYPAEWQYAALALALSGAAGFLAER